MIKVPLWLLEQLAKKGAKLTPHDLSGVSETLGDLFNLAHQLFLR